MNDESKYENQVTDIFPAKQLVTTYICVISSYHGWIVSTKCNPALIFQEENIKPSFNKFRISVTDTNISDENINIPRGHHVLDIC